MTAAASSDPGPPLAIAEIPHEDEPEQLRLALALNGGVSLAIWIGGVCMEISRLVRAEGVWGEALELTQSTARADVMAGASAGGINGALLGMAQAHGLGLDGLRNVWLDDASMDALFRSPFKADPPSILKGNEYFLERLRKVFGDMAASPATDPKRWPVHLMITATLLTGERQDFEDDLGQAIHDITHRGMFVFSRDENSDDFQTPEDAERLALAARSTASFPGAFEASFVPIGERVPSRDGMPALPDMKGVAEFSGSRFVVDGGVLVNKPVGPVLRHVFDLPAKEQVKRVLAYIVPDPGVPPKPDPDQPDDIPSMTQVVASAVTLPRQESIALELEEVREHNRKVEDLHRVRALLLSDEAGAKCDVSTLADLFFKEYRRSRLESQVEWFLAQLTVGARQLDVEEGVVPDRFDRDTVEECLRKRLDGKLAEQLPETATALRRWHWDVKTVESVAAMVSEVLSAALQLTPPEQKGRRHTHRTDLQKQRTALGRQLVELERVRLQDVDHWRNPELVRKLRTKDRVRDEINEAFDEWLKEPLQKLPGIPVEIASILADAGPTLWEVCGECKRLDGEAVSGLATKLKGLGIPKSKSGKARPMTLLRKLLAISVVQQAMTAGQAPIDQRLSLVQISADARNGLDSRSRASEKLAGIQMGHFGAFYKRSWRANDWMWGRIDGAERLAQIVLNPERIRKLAQAVESPDGGDPVEHVLRRMELLVLGPDKSDARSTLANFWNRDRARKELKELVDGDGRRDGGPGRPRVLRECAAGLARRIQLEAVIDELLHIADSIKHDDAAGARESPAALDFMEAVHASVPRSDRDGTKSEGRLHPERALQLFRDCTVGAERITQELGSDQLTNTVSTAAAVAVSAASGKGSGLGPVRSVMGSLRGFSLALYVLSRSATGKSKSMFAALMVLLATGGAMLALGLLNEEPNDTLIWSGLAIVLAGMVVATMRAGPLWVFALIASTAVLAVGAYRFLRSFDEDSPLHDLAPALTFAVVVLGSLILGFLSERTIGWLPRNSRVLAAIVAVVTLAVAAVLAAVLDWPTVYLGASILALGLVLGWVLRDGLHVREWWRDLREAFRAWSVDPRVRRRWERAAAVLWVGAAVGLASLFFAWLVAEVPPSVVAAVAGSLGLASGVILREALRRRRYRVRAVRIQDTTPAYRVTWSERPPRPGTVFDVYVKGPHSDRFTPWRLDDVGTSAVFHPPDCPGTYVFRVRRRFMGTGRYWGWSPDQPLRLDGAEPERSRNLALPAGSVRPPERAHRRASARRRR